MGGLAGLSVLDLISKVLHVRRANHDWRAGKRSPRIQQARHATPDMPVGELGRVGTPPVWKLILRRWAVLHCVLPSPVGRPLPLSHSIEQISTEQSRYTT